MSRTKKGSKGAGYEYWSKRPGPTIPGKFAKTVTHKIERQQNKKLRKDEDDANGVDVPRGGER
jgi:hypothetical protein